MRNAAHNGKARKMTAPLSPRECFLWLILAGAVGVGVFAVTQGRSSDAAAESDADAVVSDRPERESVVDSVLGHAGVDGLRDTERDNRPQGAFPALRIPSPPLPVRQAADIGTGVEMPFEVAVDGHRYADEAGSRLPHDPDGLCAVLRDAIMRGYWADVATIRDRLLALGPAAVPKLSDLLHSGVEAVEIEAFRLLVQIGNAEGVALALGKALSMPVEATAYPRMLAAFADNRSPALADWLTDTLGRTEDAHLRERLLDLLHAMRGPEAVEALVWAALNPVDDLHARDSLDSLAMRRAPSETDALAAALESNAEALRLAAANGLAGIGSGDACRILADAAESEPEGPVVAALGAVSSAYAQETLLALALEDGRSPAVRVSAVQSLSGQSGYRVRAVLENAAVQERDTAVAEAMQTALTTIHHNHAEVREHSLVTGSERGELCF